jgi:ribonucleotide monophosphatase NagD (HAD superfamily)
MAAGTLHVGNQALPGSITALQKLRAAKLQV